MATTLLFRPTPTQIADLVLDAAENVAYTADVEATDHPVEAGANVTDHARLKPRQVVITGIISNTPVNAAQQSRLVKAGGADYITTGSGTVGYAETALARLEQLRGQTLTVVTPLRAYSDMMLISLNIPKDAKTGDAVRFTATFKEIRFAELQRKIVAVPKEPKARGKTNVGKQNGEQATPEGKAEVEKSLLTKGGEALGGRDFLDGFKPPSKRGAK
jgi:hypothetical protein